MYEAGTLEDHRVNCGDHRGYGGAYCGCAGGAQHILLWHKDTRGSIQIEIQFAIATTYLHRTNPVFLFCFLTSE